MDKSDQQKRILIIEDNPNGRSALAQFIRLNNYFCDEAEDGWEGIEKLRHHPYDLVLLDIMLPYYDGYTVLELMKTESILTPVLVTSALDGQEHIDQAIQLGAYAYFIKPLNYKEVIDTISKLIQNHLSKS